MEIFIILGFQAVITAGIFVYLQRRLLLQNVALRQQLSVYIRTVDNKKLKHKIKNRDRFIWIVLFKVWPEWKEYLFFVQPATVIKWHRKSFKLFWKHKCRRKKKIGRPPITKEHIALIRRISGENPLWGEQRIADELFIKLGIKHSTSTVRKYRVFPPRRDNGNTWRKFIKNHASEIFACDFLTQHTICFHVYYIFVVMEIGSRRIIHFNITNSPSLQWVKNQIREATGDTIPRFIIHENDGTFGQFHYKNQPAMIDGTTGHKKSFRCNLDFWLFKVMGIAGIPTPYAAPNANAHLERWNRSLRTEALNHFIFFNESHLHRVVKEYVTYYNRARPSQAIHAIPDPYPDIDNAKPCNGTIVGLPVLAGLHHDYRLVA